LKKHKEFLVKTQRVFEKKQRVFDENTKSFHAAGFAQKSKE
jgi:hypothetical protein